MLDKAFDPRTAEPRLYDAWEASGAFAPRDDAAARPFCMVIPPPNVTGALHMGHALNNTLQDVLTVRFAPHARRIAALWLPGTDHAGIATQMVVERQLRGQPATSIGRRDLGREAFVAKVWEWKAEPPAARSCASCAAWAPPATGRRERFTLDEASLGGGAQGVRQPVRTGADLSRQAAGQLGPAVPDRHLRPRGRAASKSTAGATGTSPIRWRTAPARSSWPPRGPRPCWATPLSPCIRRTSATSIWSASVCACRSSAARSRSSPTTTPIPKRAPAR